MRRGIAATALVASLALAATACGGSDSGKADGPVTITWWDTSNATNEAPTYKALIKQFEAANKDIKVKYVNVPFDQAQNKFDTAAGSSGAPDVLRAEVGWTPAFAKKGYLLPLDGTEALADKSKFQSSLVEQAQYQGKTYGVPLVTDTLAFVYNKALFKKAGITEAPTTWAELKSDAAKVKSKTGVDGYWGSAQGYYSEPFLYGEGTDTVDAGAKKITVNSAAAQPPPALTEYR
jgi:arabinogalactan oligomer/maltooligosaccharide transport system substrate-binding protein